METADSKRYYDPTLFAYDEIAVATVTEARNKGSQPPMAEMFEASDVQSCPKKKPSHILNRFVAHEAGLRDIHLQKIDLIANKIADSFKGSNPIRHLKIVGHASTWGTLSREEYTRRAQKRAQNVASAIMAKLNAMGLLSKVRIRVDNRANDCPLPGIDNMPHSTSRTARENRALNRRVEINLLRVPLRKKKRPVKPKQPKPVKPSRPNIVHVLRKGCKAQDKPKVDRHIKTAVKNARLALKRFNQLDSMREIDREKSWNNGREKIWFGAYRRGRKRTPFKYVKRNIEQISRILRKPPRLIIRCDYGGNVQHDCTFGFVNKEIKNRNYLFPLLNPLIPPPYVIHLSNCWFSRPQWMSPNQWRETRATTIIHEAAHLAGARRLFNAKLFKSDEIVGYRPAKRLARRNAWGARVNAQNYAFYIMGRS